MMNVVAKTLVLMHVVLSLAGMTWALMLFLQGRDLGWKEPGMEVFEYGPDGNPANKPGAVMPAAMLPLIKRSIQEAAKAWRPAAVLASATNAAVFAADAPPNDISTFMLGCSPLSC